jgi:hypothetical protein
VLVSVESNTETLLWYENPRFAEYTAVERNTACDIIEFSLKIAEKARHCRACEPTRSLTKKFYSDQPFVAGMKIVQTQAVPRLKVIPDIGI